MSVLTIKNLRCEIGERLLFEAEHLTIDEGDVIGLIGKNGAGKTCLLKILSGELTDYSGQIYGNPFVEYSEFYMSENMSKSSGEANISCFLESFRNLASLYLLDEPTNYLDQDNFNKVVRIINSSTASFCIASHDRAFLDAVATKIWIIEHERVKEYNCSFSTYLKERKLQLSQYTKELKNYQKEKKKIKQSIQSMKEKREKKKGKPKKMSSSEYRIAGVKTKIGVKQKKLQKEISQQEDRLNQLKKPNQIEENYSISFFSKLHTLPKRQIIIPKHKAKIGKRILWSIPDITLKSGDKLGIIGKNGSGKTTYLDYVVSVLPSTYKVCYFRQNPFYFLNSNITVYDAIVESSNGSLNESQIRTLLALLDFKKDSVFKLVGQLSQGERVKVSLLAYLVTESDILILDEITNFLDLKTIEAVEKVLVFYSGILIFVSHDQHFMKNLATTILDIDNFKEE